MDQSSTAVVAFATTVHLCLAALRNHRQQPRGVSPLALVSFAFASLPWILPTPAGLAVGLLAHLAWFAACEMLAPRASGDRASANAAVASSPVRAAAPGTRTAALRPKGFVTTPILATFDETPDIKTVRLARPDGFDFHAGQFLTVRLRIDGREYARCSSISSPPDVRGYVEISVKRQGIVSNALHVLARPGGTLPVRAPAGAFTYPAGDDRPIVLIGAGVGITPLVSMLRHACAAEPTRPVTLVYGVRTETDLAFRDDLGVLARRNPQVRIYIAVSRGATQPHLYPGRIDAALLAAAAPDAAHAISFVCGPTAMIDDVRALLANRGVPAAQVRYERFEAAIAASAGAPVEIAPATTAAHAVTCAASGRRIAAQPGQTLLEAAESSGVEIDSLCRSGVCGTCRLQVTDGDARCASTVLDEEDRAAGYVLACVTTLHSDCTVNA